MLDSLQMLANGFLTAGSLINLLMAALGALV